jgi:hypothetical protein
MRSIYLQLFAFFHTSFRTKQYSTSAKNLNKQSVPYIKVDELKAKLSLFILMHAN